MIDNYVTGNTIKQLREQKHMTQNELAALIDVSPKTISKWETAKGFPDISLLEPLASALSVSVIELYIKPCMKFVKIYPKDKFFIFLKTTKTAISLRI